MLESKTPTISLEARNATDAIGVFMKSNPNTWKAGAEIIIQTVLDRQQPTEERPYWEWNGINLHSWLARFKIHSTTEDDDLLDHASVSNGHNIEVLHGIIKEILHAKN